MSGPPAGAAVQCRGLFKSYGQAEARVQALRGVDLEIRRGELLMLVGPSGCGKTTLISIIAALLEQDAGECLVFGRDLQRMNRDERARFRGTSIGFVFQMFNLLPSLCALDNVALPLLIRGVARARAEQAARAALDSVGLAGREHALPARLSGGQQQRVAIARALVHAPELIVCDEPTSSLDHATGHEVMELLRQLGRAPGRALLIVTHDARIFEFADRIARMDDGRIVELLPGAAAAASASGGPA